MTIFDVLFILLFVAGFGSLLVAMIAALRGRRARSLAILRRAGVVAAVYFGVLVMVSAFSPQSYRRIGEDQCSDDWCIAVQGVQRDTMRLEDGYLVTFRISSRAGRVAQRERFVVAYLRDEAGHRYEAAADAGAVPFDTLLTPGQAIVATRRFIAPPKARVVGVVIAREGAGRFPRCCVIGDADSWFHRRPLVRVG